MRLQVHATGCATIGVVGLQEGSTQAGGGMKERKEGWNIFILSFVPFDSVNALTY